ncbi:MAG: SIMPL domain-containing protein, partial [Acidobacteria bacterium]|nr:SIMPL domain-containing protein [Acidobacteriota bacterium]
QELKTSRMSLGSEDGRYKVSVSVGVTRQGAMDAGDLIASAVEVGANSFYGPQFSVADEKAVQDRCLDTAFADAKRKAKKLSTLAERKLGKALAVTDGSTSPFELTSRTAGVEGGVLGGLAVEAGVHQVQCGVTVAFELE